MEAEIRNYSMGEIGACARVGSFLPRLKLFGKNAWQKLELLVQVDASHFQTLINIGISLLFTSLVEVTIKN